MTLEADPGIPFTHPLAVLSPFRIFALSIIPAILSALSCTDHRTQIEGESMASTYHIVIISERRIGSEDREAISQKIQGELDRIEALLSNWRADSEVSRFNRHKSMAPFPVSEDTASVVRTALHVAHNTDGAFDPTLAGLIDLWGFGSQGTIERIPDRADILARLQRSGYRKLMVEGTVLRKLHPDLTINLSGIVDGYASDRIYKLLHDEGYDRVMVEIGGEIRAGESNWKIGIEKPSYDSNRSIREIIEISGLSISTSGDYRNFVTIGGRRYSHILDPKTGSPVMTNVISATVSGPECTTADALSTAMLVVGVERGKSLMNAFPGYEVLMIYESNGQMLESRSEKFPVAMDHR